jgi:hypothetical protein
MDSVLYLGVEGVLFDRGAIALPAHEVVAACDHRLLEAITEAVIGNPALAVVLNGWWVADVGYRSVLQLLPPQLANKTVGATMPGNRMHRRPSPATARADLLREDVRRRNPTYLTIVDASRAAIPVEYLWRSILVTRSTSVFIETFRSRLVELLAVQQQGEMHEAVLRRGTGVA